MIHVLIVEDDPMVAKFNRIYLEKIAGFTVVSVVHDTSAALTFLKNNDVDLILLDIYMANTNGLDLLVEIRNAGLAVDAIVITAANDQPSIQRALHHGAIDYLIKPFDFGRFKEALVKYQQRFDVMRDGMRIQQKELDAFLLDKRRSDLNPLDLPKGLTTLTLARIAKQIINWEKDTFSAAEIADETGISRVSISKYLKYLVGLDVLKVEANYQGTGRPLHRYQLRPENINMIQTLVAEEDH
ncbi:response regulator of citrate/malate metabolism [Virgibacillus halotolerans]|uniref:response regulator n=1 Tax=Virgibacillus halotolerans TaxID=1071053 RepID=UPI00195FC77B|nr:response regulator [Virgibacillus halotolerans]MBM7599272.1 response regulator of citrate/malate metabolism [Virgibacillus halotolerans]